MKFYLCVFDNFKNLNEVVLILLVFNYEVAVSAFWLVLDYQMLKNG
jgi:hypothetical protein